MLSLKKVRIQKDFQLELPSLVHNIVAHLNHIIIKADGAFGNAQLPLYMCVHCTRTRSKRFLV